MADLPITYAPLPLFHTSMPQNKILESYDERKQQYATEFSIAAKKHHRLGLSRLLVLLLSVAFFYQWYTKDLAPLLYAALSLALLFIVLVKLQQQALRAKLLAQELLLINEEEADYLRQGTLPFDDGSLYKDGAHAYASDLDIFGDRSLYQHLNRTATTMGRNALAQSLLHRHSASDIPARQRAVASMSDQIALRQQFYATGRLTADSMDGYNRLLRWAGIAEAPLSPVLRVISFLLPALLGAVILLYAVTGAATWWLLIEWLVPVNLMIFFFMAKRVKTAIAGTEQSQKTLLSYSALLQQVEGAAFADPYLQSLQQRLEHKGSKASLYLQQLAAIYAAMENVQNPFAAIGMNGLYLHHIHALHRLIVWKKEHANHIQPWLEVIGELEALNSLANQRYNNPTFCFPGLNNTGLIAFKDLGHPLISADRRVCSDVSFADKRFIILTGSNMSGKSTFLRTLGVNMVLAGAGGVVCATTAQLQPMDMYVSMRQSDSLADNESYFFAEVKRLKHIIDSLGDTPRFVLLDEILRGTNSDDKRSGTIGVIEKIIRTPAIGAVATHDLEVCNTTYQHPDILVNKCFEVETENDELVFDYKLRDGICRNKSATFIMKKMNIID
jgi:hypothetical protein